jgi:hypothetical protein
MTNARVKRVSALAGFALGISLLAAGCVEHTGGNNYFGRNHIRYEVTGSAPSVSVTYHNADEGISTDNDRPLPWGYAFYCTAASRYLSAMAVNNGDHGSVTVKIYVNHKLRKVSEGSGGFAVAQAGMMWP